MKMSKYIFVLLLLGSLIAGGCPLLECGLSGMGGCPPRRPDCYTVHDEDDVCNPCGTQICLDMTCGDGEVDPRLEECDDGAANGAVPMCGVQGSSCSYCSEDCKLIEIGGEIPPPPGG